MKAPTPGTINQTVASRAVRTLAPVRTGASSSFGSGISVRTASITAITATARGPGEVGGPALEIALRFTNTGSRRAGLNSVIVNLAGSDGSPASSISGAPAHPVSGSLAPKSSVVGRYVFTLAKSKRRPITISVGFVPSAPVVQIVGNAG